MTGAGLRPARPRPPGLCPDRRAALPPRGTARHGHDVRASHRKGLIALAISTVVIGASDHAREEKLRAAITAGFEVVGIADLNPGRCARAVALAEELTGNAPVACASEDEAFALGADSTIIVTPANTHAEVAEKALRLGMHVQIEKPLATDLDAVRRLIAVADEHHRGIMVGFQKLEAVREPLAAVKAGKIGRIRKGWSNWLRPESDTLPPNFWNHEETGGVLLDLAHIIHLLVELLPGRPLTAAMWGFSDEGVELHGEEFKAEAIAAGVLGFDGPACVFVDLAWWSHRASEFVKIELEGTLGRLSLPIPTGETSTVGLRATISRRGEADIEFAAPPTNHECHVKLMRRFLAACEDRGSFDSWSELLAVQAVLEAARESATRQQPGDQLRIVY